MESLLRAMGLTCAEFDPRCGLDREMQGEFDAEAFDRILYDDIAAPASGKTLPMLLGVDKRGGLIDHDATTKGTEDEAAEVEVDVPDEHVMRTRAKSIKSHAHSDVTGEAPPSDTSDVGKEYSVEERQLLERERRVWKHCLQTAELARKQDELFEQLQETRKGLLLGTTYVAQEPANRYGSDTRLPPFEPGVHVPTLALVNPASGATAGRDILSLARRSPHYQSRFFNILEVQMDRRRGGAMDVFRIELRSAMEEARSMGVRARVISAGGDGTPSFALFIIFCALRADSSRAEEGLDDAGNGFILSDEELAECFPAIAQMPLGTMNDLAHTLGWGCTYPGEQARAGRIGSRARCAAAYRELSDWIQAVIDPKMRLANFDVWGFMPPAGAETCNFKLCQLGGPQGLDPKVDGSLCMAPAGPVPLFLNLYFSVGRFSYGCARFQRNRHASPFMNKLENMRQAIGVVSQTVPPQLNCGVEGVQIACGGQDYFPPRSHDGQGGHKYAEVGFMNTNWMAGHLHGADRAPMLSRLCSSRQPVQFNDGMADMFRIRKRTFAKDGLRLQTDKNAGPIEVSFQDGRGKGVFFQYDGEARFAFSPTGEPFTITVQKMLNIPVVLGPSFDPRVVGNPDNGAPVVFEFVGRTPWERQAVRRRIRRNVAGELGAELNATQEELIAAGFQCAT